MSCLQKGGLHRSIGEDIAQHRRHIGRDHAAALDDAASVNRLAIHHRAGERALGEGIRGGDGVGSRFPAAFRRIERSLQSRFGLVLGQRHADHAGGGNEYFAFRTAQMRRHLPGDGLHRFAPAKAGEGVCCPH
jgi:hypothetical protein